MAAIDSHPSCADLEAFALGRLHDDTHAAVEEHVNSCSSCRLVIDQVPGDTLVALLRSAASASDTVKALQVAPTMADTPAEGAVVPGGMTCDLPPAEASSAADLPAALMGHPRYEPTRLLGTGGMGTVWLAQHRVMGRQVAVKVIRPEFVAKPGAAERFRRETQAAARLHHPNIVTAFDAENAGESHLLAMEYVEGVTLADLLRQRGPLPVTEACDAIRQAALGLAHASACGLIHRDLKPHNLMRTADGTVKILDFGLAVLTDVAGDGLTADNVILGTPDYIAPEQAEDSRAADVRSDIYSLGCTLYHLLTGQVPFPDNSVLRKLDAHRQREPKPILTIRPEVPVELVSVVAKMMAKKPADRFQTPAELAAVLEPFAAGTVPLRQRRRSWRPVAVAALLCAAIVAAAGVVYRIQTDNGEIVITPQSPDVEIVLLKGGKEVQIIDTRTNKRVTVPTGTYDVAVKNRPDGIEVKTNKIVVSRGQETLVIIERVEKARPAETDKVGLVRTYYADRLPVDAVRVSPDGRVIAVGGGSVATDKGWATGPDLDVRLFDRATGAEVRRFKGPTMHVQTIVFSADGKRLAAAAGDNKAYVWDVDNGKLMHALAGHKATVNGIAFLPGDKRLLTASWDRTIRLWDAGSGKEVGLLGTAPEVATEWSRGVAILAGGKEAIVSGWGRLVVLDLQTDKVRLVFDWPGGRVEDLSLSPDGKRLLTAGADGTDMRARLWDVATGKLLRTFTKVPGGYRVAFLPDGRRFLMASGNDVCLADADTGALLETFQGHRDAVMSLALVPHEPHAVSGALDMTVRLWRLPAPDNAAASPPEKVGEVRHLLGHANWFIHRIAVSPDGRFAWSVGRNDLRKWDLTTGETVREVSTPTWYEELVLSPDGKRLLIADGWGGVLRLYDAATMKQQASYPTKTGRFIQAAWFPDGRRVLTGGEDGIARIWELGTAKPIKEFKEHQDRAACVAVSPDGARILSVGDVDSILRVWDPTTGKLLFQVPGQTGNPHAACFTLQGRAILTCGLDRTIRLLDAGTGKELRAFRTPSTGYTWGRLSFAADGRHFASATSDGMLCLWDLETGKELYHVLLKEAAQALALTPDSRYALFSTSPGDTAQGITQWRLPASASAMDRP